MILPGNNELRLCGKALMEIVERHLNETTYSKEPRTRVNAVRYDDHNYVFTVTTDGDKDKQGANGA